MSIDKLYQPLELEKKWYQHWELAGYFQPQDGNLAYCIMLPPPNVTGTLHMGHAFQDTIMDALIRYHRMKGYQTLWQGGTDHAGIATQMVVERQLLEKNITKDQLGRTEFTQKIWEWKAQSGNTISRQMRRLGTSIDWTRERFTMDEGLNTAVNEVFVRLYEEGLIYRGQRLVNWDPKLHTAVSDLEVISEEEEGKMWYIRYPLEDNSDHLIIATTRPETMLGDVAVAVHPADHRYQHLIGQQITTPLSDRSVPIIGDEFVDPEFGTGCVKIGSAHDFNDYEFAKRHHLPMINIFTVDAVINQNAPLAYQGLDRFVAREKIIADLEKLGLLEKIEPHLLKIPRGDRSGAIIEPLLTDQWFVNTKPLAEAAIAAVQNGKIEFVPHNWTKIYYDWMNNIQDWCISRQIWWGHRIPAWYDNAGEIYVGRHEAEVRSKYQLDAKVTLTQDNDVLDTWFSSALWPFSTLGWPESTPELPKYYPTDVLVTGFDIIFFWVARMIMMGLKFMGDVPFKKVFVTGLILDSHGQKMSKSKGNILDPLDLIDGIDLENLVKKRLVGLMQPAMAKQIEQTTRKEFPQGIASYGTDALRFSLCAFCSNNRFIRFDLSRVEGYRNFCNKLWNASRYVFMNVEAHSLEQLQTEPALTLYDRWITSLWQKTKKQVAEHLAQFRFDMVANTLYEFTWNQYCDWYLELSKPSLQQGTLAQQLATRTTLITILEELLRAMHPIMPYITEEIWQKLIPMLGQNYFIQTPSSIMLQPYPEWDANKVDSQAEQALAWIQEFIIKIRTTRAENNLPPAHALTIYYRGGNKAQWATICTEVATIKKMAKIESLLDDAQPPQEALAFSVAEMEFSIDLAGLIDKEAEIIRIQKEILKLNKEIEGCEKKLNNADYIQKAPREVVLKEQERIEIALSKKSKLEENLLRLSS